MPAVAHVTWHDNFVFSLPLVLAMGWGKTGTGTIGCKSEQGPAGA